MSEGSAPEKYGEEWVIRQSNGEVVASLDAEGEISIAGHNEMPGLPRDRALRLLAAEASDRLGWKWTVDKGADGEPWYALCGSTHWYSMPGSNTYDFTQGLGGYGFDDAVAALHGKFLLETAMRARR